MISERDVRAKIAAAVSREIPLRDFADWILSNSWDMQKDSSAASVDLVASVELLLSERDDDVYTESQFLRRLQGLLDTIVVSPARNAPFRTASCSEPLRVSYRPLVA